MSDSPSGVAVRGTGRVWWEWGTPVLSDLASAWLAPELGVPCGQGTEALRPLTWSWAGLVSACLAPGLGVPRGQGKEALRPLTWPWAGLSAQSPPRCSTELPGPSLSTADVWKQSCVWGQSLGCPVWAPRETGSGLGCSGTGNQVWGLM